MPRAINRCAMPYSVNPSSMYQVKICRYGARSIVSDAEYLVGRGLDRRRV